MMQKNGKLELTGKVAIANLRKGTYYIYETKAASGYDLEVQRDYYPNDNDPNKNGTNSFASQYGYVYLGSTPNGGKWTNLQLSKYQYQYPPGTLIINKKDKDTNDVLNGAKFKIYAILKDGTRGWVSGDKSGKKTYGATANEYESKVEIKKLRLGTYYVYETTAPSGGEYDLKAQDGYKKASEGSSDLTGDWVFLGKKELDGIVTTNEIKVSFDAGNQKLKKLVIKKIDKTTGMELSGGKFKIYAKLDSGTTGWVKGSASGSKSYETNSQNAGVYNSKENIEKLEYGTYYVYEIEAPVGYDITKQNGYKKEVDGITLSDTNWVYLDKVKIDSSSSGTSSVGISGSTGNAPIEFVAPNQKVVSKLEGYVWLDKPDTKANNYDNVYKNGTDPSDSSNNFNDELLKGIKVTLYDNNNVAIATAKTNSSGYYKFETKNASTYTGEDKNLYYWEIANYYVAFTYDNKKYICVDPFVGNNAAINSKAQEETMTADKLDDNNLTGTTGSYPGKAVTYKSEVKLSYNSILDNNKTVAEKIKNKTLSESDLEKTTLTGYYDDNTYTISNINLGLLEKREPDYSVNETLEYVKIKLNGYEYTYKYDNNAAKIEDYVPTVNLQNNAGKKATFTGKIYPTDVAYNSRNSESLMVYAVYAITVQNDETTNIDDLYVEQKLYLNSLKNVYDTKRYELCKDDIDPRYNDDFKRWNLKTSVNENGVEYSIAYYNLDDNSNVYENGIKYGEPITSHIQFKVTKDALDKMLEKNIGESDVENAPTSATANGYHVYLRTDNLWNHDNSETKFDGCKDNYTEKNGKDDKYYVHKSLPETRRSYDLYFIMTLGKPRKIFGTVFEDTRIEEGDDKETLGDGILNDTEKNRAKDIKVELLDDKKNLTQLYKQDMTENDKVKVEEAKTQTDPDGFYELEGVVPGKYYIRFTYGDGTQKLVDVTTKDEKGDIQSSDYKSTIINTKDNGAKDIIKNAYEENTDEYWYMKLDDQKYSTAIDDFNTISDIKTAEYIEQSNEEKYTNASGDTQDKRNYSAVNAFTPLASIPIENDDKNEMTVTSEDGYDLKNEYNRFHFGIIKSPSTNIITEKIIDHVTLTNQVGTNIVSANPKNSTSRYLTSLNEVHNVGSNYAKLEIESNLIYGSSLTIKYKLSIENKSEIDYIEDDEKDFGEYYKYGYKDNGHLKTVTVEELKDKLSNNFDGKSIPDEGLEVKETLTKTSTSTSQSKIPATVKINKVKTQEEEYISITEWSGLERNERTEISYEGKALLAGDDFDTQYENNAEISKISLSALTTLTSSSEWHEKKVTTLTITPPTGQDKGYTIYIISGTILIVMGVGILLIKKFVL